MFFSGTCNQSRVPHDPHKNAEKSALEPVRLARQIVGQRMGHLGGLVFVQLMLRYQSGQESTVYPPSDVMPCRIS